jgi:threonine/homoserine/homoserine lactone efflux protein
MMDMQLYVAFVAAASILMLIPGPNVALIVANSGAHGGRYGLSTVAGTSSAVIVKLGRVLINKNVVPDVRNRSKRRPRAKGKEGC